MAENKLLALSFEFAVTIVNLVDSVKTPKSSYMLNQLARAGTSVGANIHESQYAQAFNRILQNRKGETIMNITLVLPQFRSVWPLSSKNDHPMGGHFLDRCQITKPSPPLSRRPGSRRSFPTPQRAAPCPESGQYGPRGRYCSSFGKIPFSASAHCFCYGKTLQTADIFQSLFFIIQVNTS